MPSSSTRKTGLRSAKRGGVVPPFGILARVLLSSLPEPSSHLITMEIVCAWHWRASLLVDSAVPGSPALARDAVVAVGTMQRSHHLRDTLLVRPAAPVSSALPSADMAPWAGVWPSPALASRTTKSTVGLRYMYLRGHHPTLRYCHHLRWQLVPLRAQHFSFGLALGWGTLWRSGKVLRLLVLANP